eukprot:scaffold8075_cov115-Isochrysis_galbana.AAC.2
MSRVACVPHAPLPGVPCGRRSARCPARKIGPHRRGEAGWAVRCEASPMAQLRSRSHSQSQSAHRCRSHWAPLAGAPPSHTDRCCRA